MKIYTLQVTVLFLSTLCMVQSAPQIFDPVPIDTIKSNSIDGANDVINNEIPSYEFEYQVYGGGYNFGHAESREGEVTNGKYFVLLPDGRTQTVTYYADESGYHPTITYDEGPPISNNAIEEAPSNDVEVGARTQRQVNFDSEEFNGFYDDLFYQFPSFGMRLRN